MCMISVYVYILLSYIYFQSLWYDVWLMTYVHTMELGSNSSHTEFFLSNNHIQTTSITKDLGSQFESNLKFKARINDIVKSAHQRSALIYRSFLSRDTYNLILAFKTHVRPLLKYVSPVWSPTHVMLIRSVEAVQLGFTKRLLGMDLFRILNVWLSLDFNPWTATDFWTLITDYVCSGSVVVTAYDSESGCLGSNPEWGQFTIRLWSLHRAYPSLHPSGVVHWVSEQLNIEAVTGAFKLIDGCSLVLCLATPSVVSADIRHRTKINSTAWPSHDGPSQKIVSFTLHLHYITYVTKNAHQF